ncbi:AraC family transcriptional regulator [uncultured Marinobacter sp.]|uniref:helix-turn-helix transcriptional regulator n=1 Tax=uncultured Marinobacter sp. TaxID=187379 RepID=UPI0030DB4432
MSFTPGNDTDIRRVMLVGRDRVFYFGLLGQPALRNFGCATLYVSSGAPLQVSFGQGWLEQQLVWVPPYTPHRIRAVDRQLGVVMVEPESVDMAALEQCIARSMRPGREVAFLERVFRGVARLQQVAESGELTTADFDLLFMGQYLPERPMDPRIRRVVERVCSGDMESCSAEALAGSEGLSFSRFLHLFKEETGVSLRKYRAWRRARSLLYHVTRDVSLTDIALETGYPDSTHFSHSIRKIYGLSPRTIVAGSRRLRVKIQQDNAWQLSPEMALASSHKSVSGAAARVVA